MKLITLIFLLTFTFTGGFMAQTVNLDGKVIHIGDSFESVKKQFDPVIYQWVTDSSNYSNWSYLYKYNIPKGNGVNSVAQLDFSADVNDLKEMKDRKYKYYLHSVMKYWDNGTHKTVGTNEFVQNVFDILQRNGLDKYSLDISTTQYSEHGADAKSISLKIRPNVKIKMEFNGKNNCILSENVSREEDTTSCRYVLLYNDVKNLFGKDRIICIDFPTEKAAMDKKNEYDMEYYMKNFFPPKSQIVRLGNEQLNEMPKLN